ncbi:MAG: gluconate 2-dehydrogenase subunit 3 family protein [Myxococcota bacterium]
MSRRTFLLGSLGAATALSAGTYAWLRRQGYEIDPGPPLPEEGRPPIADLPSAPFDPRAREVLAVVLDQLLPGDPAIQLPSAAEAGVLNFLDRACRHRGLRAVRADVLKLCRDLDLRAMRRFDKQRYPALSADQRDGLLAEVRVQTNGRGRYRPQRALHTTLRIALEGYLGHPDHGGNRDARVWDALHIAMPRSTEGHTH